MSENTQITDPTDTRTDRGHTRDRIDRATCVFAIAEAREDLDAANQELASIDAAPHPDATEREHVLARIARCERKLDALENALDWFDHELKTAEEALAEDMTNALRVPARKVKPAPAENPVRTNAQLLDCPPWCDGETVLDGKGHAAHRGLPRFTQWGGNRYMVTRLVEYRTPQDSSTVIQVDIPTMAGRGHFTTVTFNARQFFTFLEDMRAAGEHHLAELENGATR